MRPPDDERVREPRVVEAVLLDIDGTLLDSNGAHAQAWSDTLREAGFDIGAERVRPLVGMGSDKLLPELIGIEADSERGKALIARRQAIFATKYLPAIRPFPKANELLERMRADGLRLVVATSAGEEELRGLLRALGAEWLADGATNSDDAENSKPDPDIVRAAVDKTGVGPDRCVMIGDTPYDVAAATRSRVAIIALRCGGWGDEALRGALEIYDDPAMLLAGYPRSAIGRGISGGDEAAHRGGGGADRPQSTAGESHGSGV